MQVAAFLIVKQEGSRRHKVKIDSPCGNDK
jgi:hypothetical protein